MEGWFFRFLMMAITALAMENAVFFRVLGMNKYVMSLKSPKSGIIYGGVFTAVAFVSSLFVSFVNFIVRDSVHVNIIRAPLYFLSVALVYTSFYLGSKAYTPRVFNAIKDILPGASFNTALFGAFFVSAISGFDIFQTIGYALGSGIGYTVAILVVGYASRRVGICPVPRAFRGLPVMLVYIGIMSLALFGLIGHGVPT